VILTSLGHPEAGGYSHAVGFPIHLKRKARLGVGKVVPGAKGYSMVEKE